MSMLAPRRKSEYVQAISARTGLKEDKLVDQRIDALKEIWSRVRPSKQGNILPANWRKFDLEALKQLYVDYVVEDYGRPMDQHWRRWTKSRLITEMEYWQREKIEAEAPNDLFSEDPLCDRCKIPMVVRTNRLTHEDFWGCLMYPACRFTLPLEYGGRPTAVVQEELEEAKELSKKGYKAQNTTNLGTTSVKGAGKTKSGARASTDTRSIPAEEVSSGDETRVVNTNVTEDEMKLIMKIRQEPSAKQSKQ